MGPVRLALVVTVAALPEILPEMVLVNVCVPPQVFDVEVPKASENTPAVSITGYVAERFVRAMKLESFVHCEMFGEVNDETASPRDEVAICPMVPAPDA